MQEDVLQMVEFLERLLSQIHGLNSFPLAMEIIHGIDLPIQVGQCWVSHRQKDAVDNLNMTDTLQRLVFQGRWRMSFNTSLASTRDAAYTPSLIHDHRPSQADDIKVVWLIELSSTEIKFSPRPL